MKTTEKIVPSPYPNKDVSVKVRRPWYGRYYASDFQPLQEESNLKSASRSQLSLFTFGNVLLGISIVILTGAVIALPLIINIFVVKKTATTTTTTVNPVVTAFWSFDNNTNDLYNTYNGVAMNGPTYVTGYTGLTSGALSFTSTSSQYVTVASPFFNFTYRSFTVEMWFYPTTLSAADYALFGQSQATVTDQSIVYIIRNYVLLQAFYGDDLAGKTTLSSNTWYHVAFVYDYSTSTQMLYLNGFLENNRTSNVFIGMSGAIMIGAVYNGPSNFFSGTIDLVSVMTRAKSATEILNDASLVCYYTFDANSTYDSGPLGINGSSVNVVSAIGAGKVNDAISFITTSSYFVFGGLTLLGTSGQSYSIAVWVKPTSVSGGTIVHVSKYNSNTPTWCLAFMGFSSTGQIVIQSWSTVGVGTLVSLTGPILLTNVWTHVVHTYSSSNGMRLYLNGILFSQSGTFTYSASGSPNYIFLGSFPWPVCVPQGSNVISMGQYYGFLDEFYLYSREITAVEVETLASA